MPVIKKEWVAQLCALVQEHPERVPVFRIAPTDSKESQRRARFLTGLIWPQFGDCSFRLEWNGVVAVARLPDQGSVHVYPFGSLEATLHSAASTKPLAENDTSLDRSALQHALDKRAQAVASSVLGDHEELRFEKLWLQRGQTLLIRDGKKSPVVILAALGAFRRWVHGLPVLGRASVHIGVGGGQLVNRWGMDIRPVEHKPIGELNIITAEEGATRVISDLAAKRVEHDAPIQGLVPSFFRLGYMAHSRRVEQQLLQPVWVAGFTPAPNKGTSMGHVMAVAASVRPLESIARPARSPRVMVVT